jgi:hypothetical protein
MVNTKRQKACVTEIDAGLRSDISAVLWRRHKQAVTGATNTFP